MHSGDVGVIEPSKRQGLFTETSAGAAIGQGAGGKKLQSNVAVKMQVMRAINDTHASGTDLLKNAIVPEHVSDGWRR
jgi:hypothetical protein